MFWSYTVRFGVMFRKWTRLHVVAQRRASGGSQGNNSADKLRKILSTLSDVKGTKATKKPSSSESGQQKPVSTPRIDAHQLTLERLRQSSPLSETKAPKPPADPSGSTTTYRQRPLPVPTSIGELRQRQQDGYEPAEEPGFPTVSKSEIQSTASEQQSSAKYEPSTSEIEDIQTQIKKASADTDFMDETESVIPTERPHIREFTYKSKEPQFDDSETSPRSKMQRDNKEKYKQMAAALTSKPSDKMDEIEVEFTDSVSIWIYEQIQESNWEQLPSPQDIVVQFPSLSVQTATDIREEVIGELMEKLPNHQLRDDGGRGAERHEYLSMKGDRFESGKHSETNYFYRIGDHFSNFNPRETNPNRDPFDSFLHSKSAFDGMKQFDPDFYENGVNITGLNPASWYGFNNKAWDSYFDSHEPCVQEVESEYGKFRALITRKDSNDLSIEMMLDLRRKINKIDNDSKTICYGLTSQDRKEFVGHMDTDRILAAYNSGIKDIGTTYFSNLFHLIDDVMHLRKPMIMATSGILNGVQNSVFMAGSTRLADSSLRMVFDQCQYGQIPCGGFYYFMNIYANLHQDVGRVQGSMNKTDLHKRMLWSLMSNEPVSCWDLHEMGMVDWVMPSPNNVLLLNHIGNEIDRTFNFNFKKQDEYRHRAMIKSIIELYDRGTEWYRPQKKHEIEMIFPVENMVDLSLMNGNSLDKVMERVQQISSGKFEFDRFRSSMISDTEFEERVKNVMYRVNVANRKLSEASPLALYLSHIMYYGAIMEYEKIKNRTHEPQVGTTFFRKLLKYEYHAMCWLMHFGDFWEGMKLKVDSNYKPKWFRNSFEELMKWKDLKQFVNVDGPAGTTVFDNSLMFNQLPSSWMRPLEFEQIESDYLLFPRISSLADGQFNGSHTSKLRTKENEEHVLDYTFLRGSVPPDIQFKLMSMCSDYRANKVRQGQQF